MGADQIMQIGAGAMGSMDMQAFGERIRALRVKWEMTQQELGERLGVTAQAVSKWENGIAGPDIALLARLAGLLKVSIDELFGLPPASSPATGRENEPSGGEDAAIGGNAETGAPGGVDGVSDESPAGDSETVDDDDHGVSGEQDADKTSNPHRPHGPDREPHEPGWKSHGPGWGPNESGWKSHGPDREPHGPGREPHESPWRGFGRSIRRSMEAAWNPAQWEEFGKHMAAEMHSTVDPDRIRAEIEKAMQQVDHAVIRASVRRAVRSAGMRARRRNGTEDEGIHSAWDYCPVCEIRYPQSLHHCAECHENYGDDERHCAVCHENYGGDKSHCAVCHENSGLDERHCAVCHENYGRAEQHCATCHATYNEDETHCKYCHMTYGGGEAHRCPRAS